MVPDQQAIQYDYNGNFSDGARQLLEGQAIPFDTKTSKNGFSSGQYKLLGPFIAGCWIPGAWPDSQFTGNRKCKHVFSYVYCSKACSYIWTVYFSLSAGVIACQDGTGL